MSRDDEARPGRGERRWPMVSAALAAGVADCLCGSQLAFRSFRVAAVLESTDRARGFDCPHEEFGSLLAIHS